MIYRYLLTIIAVSLFTVEFTSAQNSYEERRAEITERQQSTRSQIENLEEQIATYNERLGFATERYEQMLRQFEELSRVITLQQERIRQMNREQSQINEEIQLIEGNLKELEDRLRTLIEQYKSTLTFLYKNGRTTELALLLSSTSFNQLIVRSFYLGKFDEHRQSQVSQIEETQRELEDAISDLDEARQRNRDAISSIRNETEELEQKKQLQSRSVELLRRDRDNLQEQVDIRQRQLEELSKALDNLVAEETRIRSEEAAGTRVVRRGGALSDDELLAIESNFRESKGRLPWPVDNGTITQKFGLRVHPVFNTRTNNPGVEISVPPRSTVRVVNDGYVIGVQVIPHIGEAVLVHHGGYYTVYGNLSDIYVRRNQVLSPGDVIGLSGDEDSLIGEVLYFQIRQGRQDVNPEEWLQRAVP
jgi:septal ring factor EnvC (AmiA/AmiB activator)